MHCIQVLAGPAATLGRVPALLSSAVLCPLAQGLALIPVSDEVEAELGAFPVSCMPAVIPCSGPVARGLPAFAAQLSMQSFVLYLATCIYAGTGGQDAIVWKDGKRVLALGDDADHMAAWPDSPISRALRAVGVVAQPGQDEFDAMGLGRFRRNEAWVKAYRSA